MDPAQPAETGRSAEASLAVAAFTFLVLRSFVLILASSPGCRLASGACSGCRC